MKILLIGGTGTISGEITKLLVARGDDVYLLNRGNSEIYGVKALKADINDKDAVINVICNHDFDVAADFIAFEKKHLERDYSLFKGRVKQFIFISSASIYQKPPVSFPITESTPLANPFWEYSRNKIDCENYLNTLYRDEKFPITIVRPSHTYNEKKTVIGGFKVLSRIYRKKPVIIPGDGSTLWTLTHSTDFAKAFLKIVGNPHAIGDSFHITSDEVLTWNQIYEIYADALGVPLIPVHVATDFICECSLEDMRGSLTGDKSNNAVFDNSKIKRIFPGFTASIRFNQGVKACVEYFLKNEALQAGDDLYDEWCDTVIEAQKSALEKVKIWRKARAGDLI